MNDNETLEVATSLGAVGGGAAAGMLAGSMAGPTGAAIGALLGAVAGGIVGRRVGQRIARPREARSQSLSDVLDVKPRADAQPTAK